MIDWKVVGVILGSLLIVGILATVALLVMSSILDNNEFELILDDAELDAKARDAESGA